MVRVPNDAVVDDGFGAVRSRDPPRVPPVSVDRGAHVRRPVAVFDRGPRAKPLRGGAPGGHYRGPTDDAVAAPRILVCRVFSCGVRR